MKHPLSTHLRADADALVLALSLVSLAIAIGSALLG